MKYRSEKHQRKRESGIEENPLKRKYQRQTASAIATAYHNEGNGGVASKNRIISSNNVKMRKYRKRIISIWQKQRRRHQRIRRHQWHQLAAAENQREK